MKQVQIALVHPPFGPSALPSLGLSLLSANLKRSGVNCSTFYWNLDLIQHMAGATDRDRYRTFSRLTGKAWFPFNEWIFSREVYDDALDHRAAGTIKSMRKSTRYQRDAPLLCEEVLRLREVAPAIVSRMVDRLEPFDVVGIGSTFLQNIPAFALARAVKKRWPGKIVVLGGANCDGGMGAALLQQFPFIDYSFTGEVDNAFPEFISRLSAGLDVNSAPGLNGRDEHNSTFSAERVKPLRDLDSLPIPDFDDYVAQWEAAPRPQNLPLILALESSRGCWWGEKQHCTFCGLNADGMGYRSKSEERFIWELEAIARKYGSRYMYMADNILPVKLSSRLLQRAQFSELPIHLFYEMKSNVKRTQVQIMAEAGITSVQPGIESFSSKTLKLMKKGVTGIQNVAFLRFAREHGILAQYSILAGFPGEDSAEYARMAQDMPKLFHLQPPMGLAEIEFHRFSPYHSRPELFGLNLRPWSQYGHIYPFPEEQISRIAYVFEPVTDSIEPRRYLKPIADQMQRWSTWFDPAHCTLVWEGEGADVRIWDHRPSFGPAQYLLQDFAAEVFHLLDEPRSLQAVVRRAQERCSGDIPTERSHRSEEAASGKQQQIRFSAADFVNEPKRCLEQFTSAGLIFTEFTGAQDVKGSSTLTTIAGAASEPTSTPYLLALPVRANFQKYENGWLLA